MDDSKWRQNVFGPYVDAWKIIKILQDAYNKPELFDQYIDEVQRFADAYAGNDFAELLRLKLLLRADDVITRMNEAEGKE